MIEQLPNRNDRNYKKIESFEEYELTNCIAYEMAIRNEEVIKLINEKLMLFDEFIVRVQQIFFLIFFLQVLNFLR